MEAKEREWKKTEGRMVDMTSVLNTSFGFTVGRNDSEDS